MEGKQIEDKIKNQERLILEIKTSLKDTDGKIGKISYTESQFLCTSFQKMSYNREHK